MAGCLAAKRSACRALASLSGLETALLSALIQLLYQPSHRLLVLLVLAIGGQAPQLRGDGGGQVVDLVVDQGGFSTGNLIPLLVCRIRACSPSGSELGVEPGVADGLVPIDVESAGDVRQQFGQLRGVPGAAAAAHLLNGVHTPFVSL
jgi:hypothetical protein